jgi:hypothetical protein
MRLLSSSNPARRRTGFPDRKCLRKSRATISQASRSSPLCCLHAADQGIDFGKRLHICLAVDLANFAELRHVGRLCPCRRRGHHYLRTGTSPYCPCASRPQPCSRIRSSRNYRHPPPQPRRIVTTAGSRSRSRPHCLRVYSFVCLRSRRPSFAGQRRTVAIPVRCGFTRSKGDFHTSAAALAHLA